MKIWNLKTSLIWILQVGRVTKGFVRLGKRFMNLKGPKGGMKLKMNIEMNNMQ